MLEFAATSSPNLFAAPGGSIWVAYYWPPGQTPPSAPITLDQAMRGAGSFLFSTAPGLDINASAAAIVAAVTTAMQTFTGSKAICWLTDPGNIVASNIAMLGIVTTNPQQMYVAPGKQLLIIPNNLYLAINSGVVLSYASGSDTLTFSQGGGSLQLGGAASPPGANIASATLPFTGPSAGAFQFTISIKRSDLFGAMRWGHQLLYNTGAATKPLRSQWYPLADGSLPNGADPFRFAVSIDPSDTTNARVTDRTCFAFSDSTAPPLISGFRTVYGDTIILQPITQPKAGEMAARLVLALGNPYAPGQPDSSWGPEGDFIMMLAPPKDGASSKVLCGLTPTETLTFNAGPAANPQSGDRLRFTANCSAFATAFPPPLSSPLLAPTDPKAPPMDGTFRTPWATIIPGPSGQASHYSAQPKGSPLFGFDNVVAPVNTALLGFVDPGYELTQTDPFPLMPYGLAPIAEFGVSFTQADLAGVEQYGAAPLRRSTIGAPGSSKPSRARGMLASQAGAPDWVTTPSGLLAQLDPNAGHWSSVVAGVNFGAGPMWMVFNDPPPKLQQALQTANLFLVAANAANLGAMGGAATGSQPPTPDGTATFYNTMSIQDWQITANVGQSNKYNDYNNILIIKGCKGKLSDLVAKPDVWTQREDFSVPGTDPTETVILSQWIAAYIQNALNQTSPYFDDFKTIVGDDNWTGILVLKASLTGLPANLSGLLSVIDTSQCFAHHFGITISPVAIDRTQPATPTIAITNSSSIFQLIYYVDPAFDQANPVTLPPSANPYDFKLLTLEALFKNTAIKSFDSYAQLTLGAFFGDSVGHMGDATNIYDTIMLKGSYQQNGGVGTFMLDSTDDNLFFMDSAVINKVEIVQAQFNTVGPTSMRFDLWGFLDFNVLNAVDPTTGTQDVPFDLFGFGSSGDLAATRQGLNFSSLSIGLDTSASPWVFTFEVGVMTFDPSRSTPRKGSLYWDFALTVKGLLSGDDSEGADPQSDPASQNFLSVPTNAPLSGVSGGPWYALQFGVDLGTMGALASDAGLNSSMLAAWAPGAADTGSKLTTYNAMAGLQLPGVSAKVKLLSLQGVLALSIGALRLTHAPQDTTGTTPYWVLWLSDIALKFLGIVKIPPNGAISFACFGNPDADGEPSALGWYAVYNQDKQKKSARAKALQPAAKRLGGPK